MLALSSVASFAAPLDLKTKAVDTQCIALTMAVAHTL